MSNQAHNQKCFHEHYLQNDYNEICEQGITIIDHAETVKYLRQKELYWYHKLKTYARFGLNERDVYTEYQTRQSFRSLDVINKYYCFCFCVFFFFFFSSPVSVLSVVVGVLFVVIVIVIVKNDHSHGLYFFIYIYFIIFVLSIIFFIVIVIFIFYYYI